MFYDLQTGLGVEFFRNGLAQRFRSLQLVRRQRGWKAIRPIHVTTPIKQHATNHVLTCRTILATLFSLMFVLDST